MEKKLVIIVAILTALINIFYFFNISNHAVDKLLFDKTAISFYFYPKEEIRSEEEFLQKIEKFSEENGVEVAQYSFLSSDKIDIYSTKKDKYKETLYIPNIIFNRDIKVHNFDGLSAVGFKNLLYIDTKDQGIVEKLSEEVKNDCELYELETSFENNTVVSDGFFNFLDMGSLPIFLFCVFVFMLVIFFYYAGNKKAYFIYRLWGYTRIQTYHILNKPLYKSLFLTMILVNAVLSGFVYRFRVSDLLHDVLYGSLKLNVTIVLLLFLISGGLFLVFMTTVNNRRKALERIRIISYLLKFLSLLFIVFLVHSFSANKMELNEKLDSLILWKDTKNLFNVNESYSPFYDELAAENVLNDKILKVYKELCESDKVFIIETTNFERPENKNLIAENSENVEYTYKMNVKNKEDLYSPQGRNIVVDKNYIRKHAIESSDEKNVIDKIDNDDNVLNILVPQKFKSYENIIEKSFKEWFYFQKVEVANMYREACRQKKIEKKIRDLKINIIYIKDGQQFFTYNPNAGDSLNRVEDSIVTVYTENVDNSFLAACFGDYIFVEAEDEYSALKEISAITKKYNVRELNSISSVYDKKGEDIKKVEDERNRLLLNTAILSVLLILLMVVITYIYYKSFFSTIVIKSLYGYSFSSIYKHLLLVNLFINLSILPFVFIIQKRLSLGVFMIIGLMSMADYLIAKIVNRRLIIKGEMQLIKGEA